MEQISNGNQLQIINKGQYYTSKFINNLLQELPFSATPINSSNTIQYFRINCQDEDESIFDFLRDLKLDNTTSFQIFLNEDNSICISKTLIFENNKICGILDNVTEQFINIISSKLETKHTIYFEDQYITNELFLQSLSFNIKALIPIDDIFKVNTLSDLTLNCLFSTQSNNTFIEFMETFGNDIVIVHFCQNYISFCSSNKLLLLPVLKSTSKKGWTNFKNDQMNFVFEHIKECKIYIPQSEDMIECLQYFPIYLFHSFALQSEIEALQKYIDTYSEELFTRKFTFNGSQEMNYSTYFYLTEKTVVGYYLLNHPDYELFNPVFVLAKNVLEHYIRSTNHVDSQALFNLGSMYSRGQGTIKNNEKTIKFYSKSALCGNTEALFNLAVLYSNNEERSFNLQKAASLYSKSAIKGNSKAQFNLGILYNDGIGVPKDTIKSIDLFERAANQNDSNAQLFLGLINYENNNKEKAIELYQKSAQNGNPTAHFNLAIMLQKENKKSAIEHYLFAVSKGIIQAMFNLGVLYSESSDIKDNEKAAKLFTLASINGHSDSQFNLAVMYSNGECGLEVNLQKMLEFYTKSALNGNSNALFNLGILYSNGEKVTQNYPKAAFYYTKASELGNCKATFNLGLLYLNGADGIQQNKEKAALLFEKVADRNSKALLHLAVMYQNGEGVKKDTKKASDLFYQLAESTNDDQIAFEYFQCAANLGNLNAQSIIELKYKKKNISTASSANGNNENQENNRNNQNDYYDANDENKKGFDSIENVSNDDDKKSNKIKLLLRKAKKGNANAQYLLGACYAVGEGVPKDRTKSLKYYLMAADQGDVLAQFAAASCFSYGKGTEVNKEKALELYLKAANQGHDKAQFAVGHFYEYGKGGVEKNIEEAFKWYKKAAKNGNKNAIKALKSEPFKA